MNIKVYSRGNVIKEGFDEQGTTESQVRQVIDPLAFYNSPDGTAFGSGNTDGEQLCTLFKLVRDTMAKNESAGSQNLDASEVSKRVEATLASSIPGGALPCPLLKYPASNSSDLEWLSFVQSIPEDFGARVVLMAEYADKQMTSISSQMQSALSGQITIPTLTKESFVDVCPPRIAKKKRDDNEEASCKLPENLSPEEIIEAITSILQNLVSVKAKVLTANSIDPATTIHQNIVNATKAASYLSKQQDAIKSGTIKITAPIAGLS